LQLSTNDQQLSTNFSLLPWPGSFIEVSFINCRAFFENRDRDRDRDRDSIPKPNTIPKIGASLPEIVSGFSIGCNYSLADRVCQEKNCINHEWTRINTNTSLCPLCSLWLKYACGKDR
jgi:hypothetical protein